MRSARVLHVIRRVIARVISRARRIAIRPAPRVAIGVAIGLALAAFVVVACDARDKRRTEAPRKTRSAQHETHDGDDGDVSSREEAAPIVSGHAIVWCASGSSLDAPTITKHRLVKLRDLPGDAALYRLEGVDERAPDARARTLDALEALRREPSVTRVEPDLLFEILPAP